MLKIVNKLKSGYAKYQRQTSAQAVLMLVFICIAASPVVDASEPTLTEQLRFTLFDKLRTAQSEQEGRQAESAIWRFWFDQSPTETIRESLDAGMERRRVYDFEAAEAHLDKVVDLAPDYAEGHNQRAFVRFLRENYAGAQTDLEKALELEPDHFGAMSGLYHILRIQNRPKAALGILQAAVDIHPWIKERTALPEEMWPEHYRQLHQTGQEI